MRHIHPCHIANVPFLALIMRARFRSPAAIVMLSYAAAEAVEQLEACRVLVSNSIL